MRYSYPEFWTDNNSMRYDYSKSKETTYLLKYLHKNVIYIRINGFNCLLTVRKIENSFATYYILFYRNFCNRKDYSRIFCLLVLDLVMFTLVTI